MMMSSDIAMSLVLLVTCHLICGVISDIHPGCKCVTYQGRPDSLSGVFTSPAYPNPYRTGISCILYTFIAPANSNMIVELMFTNLDLGEINKYGHCNAGDKLRVYLHQSTPDINKVTKSDTQICGNLSTMATRTFYSRYNILMLELSTDNDPLPHTGFRGVFNFIDSREFATDGSRQQGSECTYYFMSAAKKEGKFFSPFYPQNYPAGVNCAWIFKGDWDERVKVTFLKIDLTTQGLKDYTTCDAGTKSVDKITVYDGDSRNAPMIGRYCGRVDHEEIISTGRRLMIEFSTNQIIYKMSGFAALFKFVKDKPVERRQICDQSVNSTYQRSGLISSAGYPSGYKSGTVCTYRFYGAINERVAIRFNGFDLGPSTNTPSKKNSGLDCSVRDKLTISILLNNTHISQLAVFCGSDIPPGVMSNGPYLEIRFDALAKEPKANGFEFEYEFVTDFGIEADETVPYLSCVNNFRSSINMEGEITSPNYPGLYPKDTLCEYYFHGEGRKVMINFTHFDVFGHPPLCSEERYSDYLSLSNYFLADDKSLGRYCTAPHTPNYILQTPQISDSDFFRITFKSGVDGFGTGFRAVYKFLDSDDGLSKEAISGENSASAAQTDVSILTIFLITTHFLHYIVLT